MPLAELPAEEFGVTLPQVELPITYTAYKVLAAIVPVSNPFKPVAAVDTVHPLIVLNPVEVLTIPGSDISLMFAESRAAPA